MGPWTWNQPTRLPVWRLSTRAQPGVTVLYGLGIGILGVPDIGNIAAVGAMSR